MTKKYLYYMWSLDQYVILRTEIKVSEDITFIGAFDRTVTLAEAIDNYDDNNRIMREVVDGLRQIVDVVRVTMPSIKKPDDKSGRAEK